MKNDAAVDRVCPRSVNRLKIPVLAEATASRRWPLALKAGAIGITEIR